MIVHYDPETYAIRGMGPKPNADFPYIETEDPLALKIFLGQEKALRYMVIPRIGTSNGVIKLKTNSPTTLIPTNEKIYKINVVIENAEVRIKNDTVKKQLTIEMSKDLLYWWKNDPHFSTKRIFLVACRENDPYKPIWIKSLLPVDLETSNVISYNGTTNFTLYTVKIFGSYSYEITPI